MVMTRKMATELPFSKAPESGLNSPNNIKSVRVTAMCAMILFSFFTPKFDNNSNAPKITGMRAVIDGVVDPK